MNISLWLSLMRIVLQLTNDSSIVHFYVRDHQSSSTFMSSCLLMRNYYLIIRAGSLNQTDRHNLLVETGAFSFNLLTCDALLQDMRFTEALRAYERATVSGVKLNCGPQF